MTAISVTFFNMLFFHKIVLVFMSHFNSQHALWMNYENQCCPMDPMLKETETNLADLIRKFIFKCNFAILLTLENALGLQNDVLSIYMIVMLNISVKLYIDNIMSSRHQCIIMFIPRMDVHIYYVIPILAFKYKISWKFLKPQSLLYR